MKNLDKNELNETIARVLNSISDAFEREVVSNFPTDFPTLSNELEKIEGHQQMQLERIESYEYKMETFKRSLLNLRPTNVEERYAEYGILNGDFKKTIEKYIQKKEGSGCCADKSSYITGGVIKHLQTNQNVSVYRTYSKEEDGSWITDEESFGKRCYWCSELFKTSQDAIDWYYFYSMVKRQEEEALLTSKEKLKEYFEINNNRT